jgi:putative acetyltransferase
LVAVADNEIVGHILFSSVTVEGKAKTAEGMALAPMAVLPEYQRQGIGSKLVRAGIAILASSDCAFVIVLGHADYYPRFGFEPASSYGVRCEWEVPDDAFMILVLKESVMQGISGVARYRPEFAEAVEPR